MGLFLEKGNFLLDWIEFPLWHGDAVTGMVDAMKDGRPWLVDGAGDWPGFNKKMVYVFTSVHMCIEMNNSTWLSSLRTRIINNQCISMDTLKDIYIYIHGLGSIPVNTIGVYQGYSVLTHPLKRFNQFFQGWWNFYEQFKGGPIVFWSKKI